MNQKKNKKARIEIDLTGSDGNAFHLLGIARNLANQLGLNSAEILGEMMSSDYDNLVLAFDKHFGDYVTLYK